MLVGCCRLLLVVSVFSCCSCLGVCRCVSVGCCWWSLVLGDWLWLVAGLLGVGDWRLFLVRCQLPFVVDGYCRLPFVLVCCWVLIVAGVFSGYWF